MLLATVVAVGSRVQNSAPDRMYRRHFVFILVGVSFVPMCLRGYLVVGKKIPQKHREQINAVDDALTENLHFS